MGEQILISFSLIDNELFVFCLPEWKTTNVFEKKNNNRLITISLIENLKTFHEGFFFLLDCHIMQLFGLYNCQAFSE